MVNCFTSSVIPEHRDPKLVDLPIVFTQLAQPPSIPTDEITSPKEDIIDETGRVWSYYCPFHNLFIFTFCLEREQLRFNSLNSGSKKKYFGTLRSLGELISSSTTKEKEKPLRKVRQSHRRSASEDLRENHKSRVPQNSIVSYLKEKNFFQNSFFDLSFKYFWDAPSKLEQNVELEKQTSIKLKKYETFLEEEKRISKYKKKTSLII